MLKRFAGLSAVLAVAGVAHAQDGRIETKLINVDTGAILAPNTSSLRLYGRFFGMDEKIAYGGVQFDTGLQPEWGLTVRGSFARFASFTAGNGTIIRHGGSDIEALVRFAPASLKCVTLSLGGSLPNTPAQDQAFLTGSAILNHPFEKGSFYFGGSGVFREDSSLIGISGGVSFQLSEELAIIGDATAVVSGENTYNTSNASEERRHVFGLGLRFTPRGMGSRLASFDLGITNGIGGSTGFALTPALGRSYAFFAGATVRF